MKRGRKPEPVALVDMDGTLCDWDGALNQDYANLMEGTRVPPNIEDRIKRVIRCQHGWYRRLKELPLGFYIVSILKEIGFRIMICTKGAKDAPASWTEKAEWVAEHLSGTDMTITRDKGLVYGRILVDDKPEHILRWLKWRPRGMVVMPQRPRNRRFKDRRILKVGSFSEVDALVPRLREVFRNREADR